MKPTPRQRFLDYVRDPENSSPVISPFLPYNDVICNSLRKLGIEPPKDPFDAEIALSNTIGYEPMFMTSCSDLIFNWKYDETRSTDESDCYIIETSQGEWTRNVSKKLGMWGDESGFPVKSENDHYLLQAVCAEIDSRLPEIQNYYRDFRTKIGDNGVIVIGHPNPSWLGFQIGQSNAFYHWNDNEELYRQSMRAVYEASLKVMEAAINEGIDFMSNCSYGLEITSMRLYKELDMPFLKDYADWTHKHNSLFWYHNCGHTRELIKSGLYNILGADVIETIAPPPSGNNDLHESRRYIDRSICTKGNLDLGILRDGTTDDVISATRKMIDDVRGYPHIYSTADAVLPGTPADNYLAFIQTIKKYTDS